MTNSDQLLHVVRNSGHDYNDFGKYNDCHRGKHSMNYYLVSVLDKFPVPLAVGLCLPAECSLEDVRGFAPTLMKVFQGALPNIVEDVKGFDHVDIGLKLEDLRIIEPRTENKQVTKVTVGSWFIIIFMSLMVSVTIGATLYLMKKRQDEI
jgi:hypothetical protein